MHGSVASCLSDSAPIETLIADSPSVFMLFGQSASLTSHRAVDKSVSDQCLLRRSPFPQVGVVLQYIVKVHLDIVIDL